MTACGIFDRGATDDFYEKRKINVLNELGRQRLVDALLGRQVGPMNG